MKIGRNDSCSCGGKKYFIENIDDKLDSFQEQMHQTRKIFSEYSLEDCFSSIYAIAA